MSTKLRKADGADITADEINTGISDLEAIDGETRLTALEADALQVVEDANEIPHIVKPNGKKHYYLTTAITANSTLDDAVAAAPVAGDTAETSHATGLSSIFVSDGTKWQFLTNA